ncbi:MAG: tRNA (guanosine(37)-N1)-methyltransferase TrmD [Gammaproteobacteria bacterium]
MWWGVVTLFPELFVPWSQLGVVGRAHQKGLFSLALENPRRHTRDVHQTVDDRPYGGGPGMILKPEPLDAAILHLKEKAPSRAKVIYLSPTGRRLVQADIEKMGDTRSHILIAGRYEGIDQRVLNYHVDEEWSIGDYVLSGGEVPAMVVMEAAIRLIPGVLGHPDSAIQDSFSESVLGLLEYPQYTRPTLWRDMAVPDVLTSGDHQAIRAWRQKEALRLTADKRPDLLTDLRGDDHEQRN